MQPRHRGKTGAMSKADPLHLQFSQPANGPLHPVFVRAQQVHAADHGVNPVRAGQRTDIVQRVDHAGMCAAQQDNQPSARLDKHRLIIDQRISRRAGRIKTERAACVFEIIPTWNRTGQTETIAHLHGTIADGRNLPNMKFKLLERLDRRTDGSHVS